MYNRQKELTRLYKSLMHQDSNKFTWVIIDDGSTKKIKDCVVKWAKEASFKIVFYEQENSGKMMAYKKAIYETNADWSMVIDSDDFVERYCVTKVHNIINKLKNRKDIIGAVFPRNKDTRKWNSLHERELDIIDLRYRYGIKEAAILIKNQVLKRRFDNLLIPGEKFLSEEVLYNKLSYDGKFIAYNNAFYNSKYLKGGITLNIFRIWQKNPIGTLKLLLSRYKAIKKLPIYFMIIGEIKTILNFNAFCMSQKIKIWQITPNPLLSFILYYPSIILKKIRFH